MEAALPIGSEEVDQLCEQVALVVNVRHDDWIGLGLEGKWRTTLAARLTDHGKALKKFGKRLPRAPRFD